MLDTAGGPGVHKFRPESPVRKEHRQESGTQSHVGVFYKYKRNTRPAVKLATKVNCSGICTIYGFTESVLALTLSEIFGFLIFNCGKTHVTQIYHVTVSKCADWCASNLQNAFPLAKQTLHAY